MRWTYLLGFVVALALGSLSFGETALANHGSNYCYDTPCCGQHEQGVQYVRCSGCVASEENVWYIPGDVCIVL
jgi:hypothetical protein